ncbi:hypothetical protein L596_007016 [Steinernema carpocapsae]|uniref:Uncharacterized protein n=1 Tax=Steinernema carpocapsae TaxID=34508 RepID=A0A4U5P8N5_STECR|nr:hypothetical protein L596_007016 [Steinernema carpocapsae]
MMSESYLSVVETKVQTFLYILCIESACSSIFSVLSPTAIFISLPQLLLSSHFFAASFLCDRGTDGFLCFSSSSILCLLFPCSCNVSPRNKLYFY